MRPIPPQKRLLFTSPAFAGEVSFFSDSFQIGNSLLRYYFHWGIILCGYSAIVYEEE